MSIKTYNRLNLIFIIVIVFLLTNCSKYCALHYPPTVKDSISYVEKISYKDTTIVIKGDTMVMFIEGIADTVYIKENSKQKVTTIIKNNTVKTEAICKDDSLKAEITFRDTIIETFKTLKPVKEFVTPFWNWVLFGALAVVILFLVIRIIFKR